MWVLLAEDDDDVAGFIFDVIDQMNHNNNQVINLVRVKSIADGRAARKEARYDLVLSDGILDDGNSEPWLEEIRRDEPEQPILRLSATETSDGIPSLTKPVSVETLKKKIKELLAVQP